MSNSFQTVGRFAPSPSGDLHFGSLIAALGSFLSARSVEGRWLVRIEDIDPPREVPGSAARILKQLEHYGLTWDGEVMWQSQRHNNYREILDWLITHRQSYYCDCSRRQLQQSGRIYSGHCRSKNLAAGNTALRLRQQTLISGFYDRRRGWIASDPAMAKEDFIIHRRDGLFAYNLAVVVDDHGQGVTEIVRGADLIDPTVRQIALYQQLGWALPEYLHLPLVLASEGLKLSKQNHAPALPQGDPRPILIRALQILGQQPILGWQDLSLEQLLKTATQQWSLLNIPIRPTLLVTDELTTFSNQS